MVGRGWERYGRYESGGKAGGRGPEGKRVVGKGGGGGG